MTCWSVRLKTYFFAASLQTFCTDSNSMLSLISLVRLRSALRRRLALEFTAIAGFTGRLPFDKDARLAFQLTAIAGFTGRLPFNCFAVSSVKLCGFLSKRYGGDHDGRPFPQIAQELSPGPAFFDLVSSKVFFFHNFTPDDFAIARIGVA
jgi:hypothetical protein